MSKMTSAERLQIAGKLLGVKKEDVNQFGARTSRLANLAVRHRRALRKTLECCLEGIFALVWVGDADELGLRALLGLEKSSSGIGEKLVQSFRTSVALAYSLRKIDHQRQTSHFHQLCVGWHCRALADGWWQDQVALYFCDRDAYQGSQCYGQEAEGGRCLRCNDVVGLPSFQSRTGLGHSFDSGARVPAPRSRAR